MHRNTINPYQYISTSQHYHHSTLPPLHFSTTQYYYHPTPRWSFLSGLTRPAITWPKKVSSVPWREWLDLSSILFLLSILPFMSHIIIISYPLSHSISPYIPPDWLPHSLIIVFPILDLCLSLVLRRDELRAKELRGGGTHRHPRHPRTRPGMPNPHPYPNPNPFLTQP